MSEGIITVLLEGWVNDHHRIERTVSVHPSNHDRLMEALASEIEDFNNAWPKLFKEITWRKL